MKNFVAIDFETANHHRSSVCSIGLVFVENGQIVDRYYQLIKPNPDFYNDINIQVHGITSKDTENAPTFSTVWKEIAPKLEGKTLVAHNRPFDESCLKAVLAEYGLPEHQNPFLCSLAQARKVFPELPDHKLNTVSAHIGFNLTDHHHALADAEACAYIALRVFSK